MPRSSFLYIYTYFHRADVGEREWDSAENNFCGKMQYISSVLFVSGTFLIFDANCWRSTKPGLPYSISNNGSVRQLTIGLIVPHTNFGVREYVKAINTAVGGLHKARGQPKFSFLKKYNFTQNQVRSTMMELTPSPTGNSLPPSSLITSYKNQFLLYICYLVFRALRVSCIICLNTGSFSVPGNSWNDNLDPVFDCHY